MNLFTNTYAAEMAPYSPGQKFDIGFDHVETGIAAEALNFGEAAVKNSGDNRIKKPAASGDKFRGIVLKSHTVETGKGYAINDPVPVLRQGRASVTTSGAVAVDAVAYADVSAPGNFTATATGNIATGGVFRSDVTAVGGGVAILEINLP